MNTAQTAWHDNGTIAWAETDDPRVLAVIRVDDEGGRIYGDAYAPAYQLDYPRDPFAAGETYRDDESDAAARAWQHAHAYAVNMRYPSSGPSRNAQNPALTRAVWADPDGFTERYMRVFWETDVRQVGANGETVLILNTPGFRKHTGVPTGTEALDGDVSDWNNALAGNVYGIGYAVNESRVLDDGEPVDPTDDGWEIEMMCWGFIGTDYAKGASLEDATREAALPEMLDI